MASVKADKEMQTATLARLQLQSNNFEQHPQSSLDPWFILSQLKTISEIKLTTTTFANMYHKTDAPTYLQ